MPLTTRQLSNAGAPLYSPTGVLLTGVSISFTLVDSSGGVTDAFDVITGERVVGVVNTITDINGIFTINLWPNDRGDKVTKYICSIARKDILNFASQVPSGAGVLSWLNFRTNGIILTPAQVTTLDAHIADSNIHLSPIQLDLKADKASPVFTGNLVMAKAPGTGVKLGNIVTNSYGWNDLIGILSHNKGGTAPILSPVIGGQVQEFAYTSGEQGGNAYHIKHDHAPNTDMFIHLHWMHNGTAISGNLVVDYYFTYAKSHQQAIFTAEKNLTITIPTPNITSIPRYQHMLSEIQLSSMTPNANQLDSALLEPDGEILMHMTVTTAPTTTGSSRLNSVFIFHVDIHYQSTGLTTINKAPNFYA